MGGNPGENLILFVFYVSIIGIGGGIIVLIWINISDIISKKRAKDTPDNEREESESLVEPTQIQMVNFVDGPAIILTKIV
jgi:hypothetical protein